MPHLPIAAAARLCGCHRSTLQRAIRAGRLHLNANHQLDTEELTRAGYLHTAAAQQPHAAAARSTLGPLLRDMHRTLERLAEVLDALTQTLRQMQQERSMLPTAGAQQPHLMPQEGPQQPLGATQGSTGTHTRPRGRTQPKGAHEGMQQGDNETPAFDTTRFTLGRLCPRGHDYQRTGQTLRKRHSGTCAACEREQQRERRARKRQGG